MAGEDIDSEISQENLCESEYESTGTWTQHANFTLSHKPLNYPYVNCETISKYESEKIHFVDYENFTRLKQVREDYLSEFYS